MNRTLIVMLCLTDLLTGCSANVKVRVPEVPEIRVEWPLGTVLVSKNNKEEQNKSPGDQNHLAIYTGSGQIVESQEDQGGVIATKFATYKARDYTWFPMFPVNEEIGAKAASRAKTLVGLPYRQISSLLPADKHPDRGLNCVSVVRISYADALAHDLPRLNKPDDILLMTDVFTRKWSGYKIKINPESPAAPVHVPVPVKKAA